MPADVNIRFKGDARSGVAAAHEMQGALRGAGSEAEKTKHHFALLAAQIAGKAVIGATVAMGALGAAVGVTGIKYNMMREQAQVAFTTMLGSGEKAKKFLDGLQDFADKTPFAFPDLVQGSQRLMAMGFAAKDVIPTMTAVGNAVSGIGGSPEAMASTIRAMGQVQAKGRLMAEEMMQLNEAGTFSWRGLAESMGVSIQEAQKKVEKGMVSSEMFMKAFTENSAKHFGGMMEKQSHTFQGLFSTIKDVFGRVSGQIMQPFFDFAVKGMQKVVDFMGTDRFKGIVAGISRVFSSVGSFIGDVVVKVGGFAIQMGKHLVNGFQAALPFIRTALSFIGDFVGEAFDRAKQIASAAGEVIGNVFSAVWPKVQKAAEDVLEHVKGAAETIGGAIARTFDKVKPHLDNLASAATTVLTALGKRFVSELSTAATQITKTWAALVKQFTDLGPTLDKLFKIVSDVAGAAIDAFGELSDVLFILASEIIRATLIPVLGLVLKAIAAILEPIDKVARALGGWKLVIESLTIAWGLYKAFMIAMWAQQAALVVANVAIAKAAAIQIKLVAMGMRAALIATGWGALAVAAGVAIALIISHWDAIKRFFTNWRGALNAVKVTFIEIGKGILGWMVLPFTTAIDLVLRLIEALLRKAKAIPLVGKAIPQGVIDGIKKARESVENFQKSLIPDLGAIKRGFSDAVTTAADAWNAGASQFKDVVPGATSDQSQQAVGPVRASTAGARAAAFTKTPEARKGTYVFGAITPGVAYDCSGLVVAAYAKSGIKLPHNARAQFLNADGVNVTGQEMPGDALFFNNGKGEQPGHVGIYIGNGEYIHYNIPGQGVHINKLADRGSSYMGARRWYTVQEGKGGGDVAVPAGAQAQPKPKPTTTTTAPPPGATTTTTVKTTKVATAAAIKAVKDLFDDTAKSIGGIKSDSLEAALRAVMAKLAGALKTGMLKTDLADIQRQQKKLAEAIKAAASYDDLMADLKKVTDPGLKAFLTKGMKDVFKAIGDGVISPADLKLIDDRKKQMKAALAFDEVWKSIKTIVDPQIKASLTKGMGEIRKAIESGGKGAVDAIADLKKKTRLAEAGHLFDELVAGFQKAKASIWEMFKSGLLTPEQWKQWEDDVGAFAKATDALQQAVANGAGPKAIEKLAAAAKAAYSKITADQKQFTEDTKKNREEAAKAAADLAAEWTSMVGGAVQSAGLTVRDIGKKLSDELRKAGTVIAGSVTSAEFLTAKSRFEEIQKILSNFAQGIKQKGINAAVIQQLKDEAAQIKPVMQDYINTLVTNVTAARQAFTTAWDKFQGLALQAFDKAHDAMRKAIKVALTFDGLEVQFSALDLTPAERQLRQVTDEIARIAHDAEEQRLKDAIDAAETEEARHSAQLELDRFYFTTKADQERAAADAALLAEQAAFDERTAAQRENFQTELAVIGQHMADGTLTYDEGLAKTVALFKAYNVPFGEQSGALGQALSAALIGAFGMLQGAMNTLADAISRLVERLGGEVGKAQGYAQQVMTAWGQAGSAQAPLNGMSLTQYLSQFAGGGIVPRAKSGMIAGTYTPNDSLVARLSPGEMILNPKEQANLFHMAQGIGDWAANGGGGGGGITVNVYPQGSVIAERDLANTIRGALAPVLRANGQRPL